MGNQCAGFQGTLGHEGTQNGYPILILITDCPRSALSPDIPEIAIIKIISGQDALHTVQIAQRGPFEEGLARAMMDWTVPQVLCDPARPQSPCP